MDGLSRAKILIPVFLVAVLLLSVPAFSQQGAAIERGLQAGTGAGVEQVLTQSTDLAGEWTVRNWQSVMERGQGSALGDYRAFRSMAPAVSEPKHSMPVSGASKTFSADLIR